MTQNKSIHYGDDDHSMSFYHKDDSIEPGLVVCDVQEEVYGKSAFEVFDFVDEMTRTQLGFESLEDRKQYLALLEELGRLRQENRALRADNYWLRTQETEDYQWPDDSVGGNPSAN